MFKGVGTALITPFSEDGAIDEGAFERFVDWQIEEGVNFVVPCGTTGENPALTADEHRRVVELAVKAANGRVPVLAGAGTISEMLALAERGLSAMKFFPAEASGGRAYLSAVHGPLPGLRFCPTGGVTPANAADYLALPNVGCVGGSWLTPPDAVAAGDWARVEELARAAAALG